jgi:hypothetical protein
MTIMEKKKTRLKSTMVIGADSAYQLSQLESEIEKGEQFAPAYSHLLR